MKLSKNNHLKAEDIIKNGSFFTPLKIVDLAKKWLKADINDNDVVIDFGAGYGAFIHKFMDVSRRCIATDVDMESIIFIQKNFPKIQTILENSLVNINRDKYQLKPSDRVIIIGNPPYNDVTSQYKKGEKGHFLMDESIYSKDMGISFMKMYSLLEPEFICILHPLSYLIKKTNFNSLKHFKDNYILQKGLIFSSFEFESIKNTNSEFPVCLALYKREKNAKMDFDYIRNFSFSVLDSEKIFSLNQYETIDGWVQKYPSKSEKLSTDLQFYTMRDINALKRNKTFIVGDVANGIKVEIDVLYKYAWLDYFKLHFKSKKPFIYGNLSPIYSKKLDEPELKKLLIAYIYHNNQIVKNFLENKQLKKEVLAHYYMESFDLDYSPLNKILHSLDHFN